MNKFGGKDFLSRAHAHWRGPVLIQPQQRGAAGVGTSVVPGPERAREHLMANKLFPWARLVFSLLLLLGYQGPGSTARRGQTWGRFDASPKIWGAATPGVAPHGGDGGV